MKKQEKSVFVKKLTAKLKSAKSISLVDFAGMGVKSQQELKKKLKEAKGGMFVAKNTLIRIAGKEANLPEELLGDTILKGQTAVVVGDEDPISPIQILGKFLETNDTAKMKAGVVEGQFQNKEGLIALSKLPSKEILVGQALGAIAGPMYSLINTLEAKMREIIVILNTKAG